jgi:beta-glucosidase
MPDAQKVLLRELKKLGKPIVMVLFNGRAMSIVEEDAAMDAILDVWFPGSMAGYAVADVLFGNVNPSGKLPSTFPRTVGQLPMAYNHKNTGRPLPEGGWYTKFRSNYMDVVNEPLYPFGYGLSYTTFEYGDLTLSAEEISAQQTVTASITVKNTGKVAGEEVVQMYIRDLVGSITRPVKELKGFEKISLQPGESKTVEFVIDNEMLSFYNDDLVFGSEPGEFSVMVGTNSRDVVAKNFVLK